MNKILIGLLVAGAAVAVGVVASKLIKGKRQNDNDYDDDFDYPDEFDDEEINFDVDDDAVADDEDDFPAPVEPLADDVADETEQLAADAEEEE